MSRHSYFELFLSTFRFIHVHTWIIQLFIFLSGITMALNFKNLQPISEIMLCITGVIFISALFFLDELFKSSESTNGRHLLIGRILENNADEKGEPQYEEK